MATKAEVNAVYAAGLIQGITLVTFPAASTIFTSPSEYGLSNTQYGTMFLPQVITAITGALLGGKLAERFGIKRVFLAGLVADLASMALLIVSQFFTSDQPVAYGLLLAATACLGAGFGLTVPAINALTAAFHPDNVRRTDEQTARIATAVSTLIRGITWPVRTARTPSPVTAPSLPRPA
jgi:MFS family permease